jgi:hypothetical protein
MVPNSQRPISFHWKLFETPSLWTTAAPKPPCETAVIEPKRLVGLEMPGDCPKHWKSRHLNLGQHLKRNEENPKGCEAKGQPMEIESPNSQTRIMSGSRPNGSQPIATRHPTRRQSKLRIHMSQNRLDAVTVQIAIAVHCCNSRTQSKNDSDPNKARST